MSNLAYIGFLSFPLSSHPLIFLFPSTIALTPMPAGYTSQHLNLFQLRAFQTQGRMVGGRGQKAHHFFHPTITGMCCVCLPSQYQPYALCLCKHMPFLDMIPSLEEYFSSCSALFKTISDSCCVAC